MRTKLEIIRELTDTISELFSLNPIESGISPRTNELMKRINSLKEEASSVYSGLKYELFKEHIEGTLSLYADRYFAEINK